MGAIRFSAHRAIRAASVDRYRGIANPRGFHDLETLSLDETVAFVRSFMLFSMLATSPKTGKARLPKTRPRWRRLSLS